jgi:hypothetical protein
MIGWRPTVVNRVARGNLAPNLGCHPPMADGSAWHAGTSQADSHPPRDLQAARNERKRASGNIVAVTWRNSSGERHDSHVTGKCDQHRDREVLSALSDASQAPRVPFVVGSQSAQSAGHRSDNGFLPLIT